MTTVYSDATWQQMQFLLPALLAEEADFIVIINFSEDYRSHTNTVGPNTHSLYIGTMGHLSSYCSFSSLSMALQRFVGCFPHWLGIVMGAMTKRGTLLLLLLYLVLCLCTVCMHYNMSVLLMCSYFQLAHSILRSITQLLSAVHQSHSRKNDLEVLTWDMGYAYVSVIHRFSNLLGQ